MPDRRRALTEVHQSGPSALVPNRPVCSTPTGRQDRELGDELSHPIKVVLADESAAVRLLLSSLLRDDSRFDVIGDVSTGAAVLDRTDEADLVVVDLVLADTDAFTLIGALRSRRPELPVVVYAEADPPYLRSEAALRGASGFFTHATDPTLVLDGFAAAAADSR